MNSGSFKNDQRLHDTVSLLQEADRRNKVLALYGMKLPHIAIFPQHTFWRFLCVCNSEDCLTLPANHVDISIISNHLLPHFFIAKLLSYIIYLISVWFPEPNRVLRICIITQWACVYRSLLMLIFFFISSQLLCNKTIYSSNTSSTPQLTLGFKVW